jgi:hypothetical protein
MNSVSSFRTFGDFYAFYLGEHANRTCRRLHFVGTTIAVALLIAAVITHGGGSSQWRSFKVMGSPGWATSSSSTIGRRRSNIPFSA